MTLFRANPETEMLVRRLREAAANGEDRIPYEELSRLIDRNVQDNGDNGGYGYLRTARLRVQEEDGNVWSCERGRGLYLTTNCEKARIGEVTAKKVSRQVHRDTKVLRTVDVTELKTTADQDAFNISAARLTVMKAAASRRVGNRIASTIREEGPKGITEIPLTKALDIMRAAYPNRPNKAEPEEPEGNPQPAPDA